MNPNPPMLTVTPVTGEPVTAQPVTAQPVTAQPVTAQPVTAQPVVGATAQPVTAQPVTAQPVTAQPVTTQPVTAQPVTAQPVTAPPTVFSVVIGAEEAPVEQPAQEPIVSPAEGLTALSIVESKSKDSKDSKDSQDSQDDPFTISAAMEEDFGLGNCEGICKDTSDCADGLICYDGGPDATSVPGCYGTPFGKLPVTIII